jgi:Tol biopolymer transport system component
MRCWALLAGLGVRGIGACRRGPGGRWIGRREVVVGAAALVAAFATMLATASSPSRSATATPSGGVVLAALGGSIVAVNADGSGFRRLTDPGNAEGLYDDGPVASPDGSRIAFIRNSTSGNKVMVIAADGSGPRTLGVGSDVRWSPDGTQLAFETVLGIDDGIKEGTVVVFAYTVSLVSPDGSGARLLVGRSRYSGGGFDWSPDGRSIAFTGNDAISTVDVRTGAVRQLVAKQEASKPAWSPDGSRIAFIASYVGVFVTTVGGSTAGPIGPKVDIGNVPLAWSPDGTRIAYQADGKPPGVVVVDAHTGHVTARVPSLGHGGSSKPAWSPDGYRFAFQRSPEPGNYQEQEGAAWVSQSDGSSAVEVTRPLPLGGSHGPLSWLPGVSEIEHDTALATARISPLHSQPFGNPYFIASADGHAVAFALERGVGHVLGVWRGSGPINWINAGQADRAALAGSRVYWSWYFGDPRDREGGSVTELWTATWPGGKPKRLVRVTGPSGGPELQVEGDSSLAVYTLKGNLYRLNGDKATLIRTEKVDYLEPLSVDEGRVLIWNGKVVEVVSATGRLLGQIKPGEERVYAVISGSRALFLDQHRILSYELPGARPGLTLPVGFPGRATGAGFPDGSFLPYLTATGWDTAGFRLVDVDSGQDAFLSLPRGNSPTSVAVTEAGLFYTAAPPYSGHAGEAGFVPKAQLENALTQSGTPAR